MVNNLQKVRNTVPVMDLTMFDTESDAGSERSAVVRT